MVRKYLFINYYFNRFPGIFRDTSGILRDTSGLPRAPPGTSRDIQGHPEISWRILLYPQLT